MSVLIFNHGGGAPVDLNITAYASAGSLPANAAAGDIAVITALSLTSAYARATAPSTPSTGNIWVWTGSTSRQTIQLTDKITLFPRGIYRWSGSAWVIMTSFVYSGSAWVQLSLAVYDTGNEILSPMTQRAFGGNNYSYVTFTEQAAAVYGLRTNTGDWGYRCYSTDNTIDLTALSKIRMTYTRTTDFTMTLYVSGINTSYSATASAGGSAGTNLTVDLDVSALNGLYYIGVYAGCWNNLTGSGYIYKIELIP